jgi:hypothetical protein
VDHQFGQRLADPAALQEPRHDAAGEPVAALARNRADEGIAVGREGERADRRVSMKPRAFTPHRARFIHIPKRDGGLRPIAVLPAQDLRIARAVARGLAPFLDPALPKHVYSHRLLRKKGSRRLLSHQSLRNKSHEDWDEHEWYVHFARVGRSWIETQGYRFVARTDVAAYAENINHEILLHLVREKIRDPRQVDFLSTLLQAWSRPNPFQIFRGLPQGLELTSLLANYYLLPLDRFLAGQALGGRLRCVRFMDDIWTFSKTRALAERVQRRIGERLKDLCLNVNSKKTMIFEPKEILTIIDRLTASHV